MPKKKQWKEMTPAQRVGLILLGILQIALLIAALWDIQHRSDDEINGSKELWRTVAFINFIGPMAYFVFGRKTTAA